MKFNKITDGGGLNSMTKNMMERLKFALVDTFTNVDGLIFHNYVTIPVTSSPRSREYILTSRVQVRISMEQYVKRPVSLLAGSDLNSNLIKKLHFPWLTLPIKRSWTSGTPELKKGREDAY